MGEEKAVKCTFGVRAPIDQVMLSAQIDREIKHFKLNERFVPNFNVNPVSSKFYAKHELSAYKSAEEEKRVNELYDQIILVRAKGPRNKFPKPVCESHNYGWYTIPELVNRDRRFYRPRVECSESKFLQILIMFAKKKSKDD